MMINRLPYRSQPMNMVHKTSEGSELYIGDYFAATNIALLKQKEIKAVLTSAAMLNIRYPKELGISHKVINASDIPSYKMTPHFQEAYEFIEEGLRRGNVLVHCAAGISRSTTFTLVYLMRAEGMTFKQSWDYVKKKRPIVYPNEGFQKELKKYETVLQKMSSRPQQEKVENTMARTDFEKKEEDPDHSKTNQKMSSTLQGYGRANYSVPKDQKGVPRGTSLRSGGMMAQSQTSKIHNQFLTFKFESPKIVTIKK